MPNDSLPNAPRGGAQIPPHMLELFPAAADPALTRVVKVTNRKKVKQYGFAFDRVQVPIKTGGVGTFQAVAGETKLLEWIMIGDPGGSMTVALYDVNGNELDRHEPSSMPDDDTRGYDAFEVTG